MSMFFRNKIKDNNLINSDNQRNYLKNEIINIISKISKINAGEINDDILIREELNIDSLMAMEILSAIEVKFKIKVNEEEIIKISTIGEFINMIYLIIHK